MSAPSTQELLNYIREHPSRSSELVVLFSAGETSQVEDTRVKHIIYIKIGRLAKQGYIKADPRTGRWEIC